MNWIKLGRVFCPEGSSDWLFSHASNPVAIPCGGDEFRLYFTCRDRNNRGHIAFVDVELTDSFRVLRIGDAPVVAPGSVGSFDDSGCTLGCVIEQGDTTFLYYMGWNLGVTVPCRNSIGLAIKHGPNGDFLKYSLAPIVDRSAVDPYSLSYPCILVEQDRWRMWYGSHLRTGSQFSDMHHVIKYAESRDGIHWQRDGVIALPLEGADEYALCRPWVVRDGRTYRMWFCHRGDVYRLGYAESPDGIRWQRRPAEVGIDLSAQPDWDSQMLAYPSVFRHRDRWYLLYTGNHYGQGGFGLAVEEARQIAAA